jgi:Uma2 family endonuclease
MATVVEPVEAAPWVVLMPSSVVQMNDDQFFKFCQFNRDLRIERTARGDILVMAPAGSESSRQNADLTMQLRVWAKQEGSGIVYDSSAGFKLPNGATRSPDASWILKSRLKRFSQQARQKFLPLCPDFVVELKSPTDRLSDLQAKMREYVNNGARLGWLINPETMQVLVYRPGSPVEVLDKPEGVAGGPEFPGFVLDLSEIWNPEL